SAMDVIVHVARSREGRQVACVGVLQQTNGNLLVATALGTEGGRLITGPAWGPLASRLGIPPGQAMPGDFGGAAA
ncbi:MAG: secretion system protein E, partial [Actinomycetota bacterium]|nr:secretion system protein E [Actinomycetota bacterium]